MVFLRIFTSKALIPCIENHVVLVAATHFPAVRTLGHIAGKGGREERFSVSELDWRWKRFPAVEAAKLAFWCWHESILDPVASLGKKLQVAA